MVLNAEPVGDDVTITVTSSSSSIVSVDPSSLTFTKDNWDTEQDIELNITADNNSAAETATLSHSATGGGYDSVEILSLTIMTIDIDSDPDKSTSLNAIPGNKKVILIWTAKIDYSIEKWQYRQQAGGSWGSWTDISDSNEHNTNDRSYTVSSLNNDTEHTFPVRSYNIGSDRDGEDEVEPNGYSDPSDEAPTTPKAPSVAGIIVSSTAITVVEDRRSHYIMRLNSAPAGNVTVTPRSSDSGTVRLRTLGHLTFSTSNWDTF